jgi:hypothetical protein
MRPPQTWGANLGPGRPGAGLEWRATIERDGADGTKQTHEVARGGGTEPLFATRPARPGAGQRQDPAGGRAAARAEYSALRRHCRGLRLLKAMRTRRLDSPFGAIEVTASRIKPRRYAVTARSRLFPAEPMPDRCTPEFEPSLIMCRTRAPHVSGGVWDYYFTPADSLADAVSVRAADRRARPGARSTLKARFLLS